MANKKNFVISQLVKFNKMQNRDIVIKYQSVQISDLKESFRILVEEAKRQTKYSYAEYSKFNVGAAILLETGEVITGNNQENVAYPSGLCAERTAMFYANARFPDKKPLAIAIAAYHNGNFLQKPITPCGSCLQVLLETEKRYQTPLKVILYGEEEIYVIDSVSAMLPFAFVSF